MNGTENVMNAENIMLRPKAKDLFIVKGIRKDYPNYLRFFVQINIKFNNNVMDYHKYV